MRRCASFSRRRRAQDVSALQLQTWLVHQAFRRCCEPCRPLPHLFRPAHHAAHVMMTLSRGFCIKMSYVGRPVQSLSISRRKSFRLGLRANVVAMDHPCRFRARESELRSCPRSKRLRRGQRLYFRFRHAYLKRGFLREPAQISRPPTTAPPPLPGAISNGNSRRGSTII